MVTKSAAVELRETVLSNNNRPALTFKDPAYRPTREDVYNLVLEARKRNRVMDMGGRDLRGLDLSNIKFPPFTNLRGAKLEHANLKNSDISWADLASANFDYADLRGTGLYMVNTRITSFKGARFRDHDTNENYTNTVRFPFEPGLRKAI